MTFEGVLAAVLLMSDVPESPERLQVYRPSILALAMDAEILDPREKGFVLGHDPVGDLGMLRNRFDELRNAPRLDEVERFPARTHANEVLAANRAYRNELTARLNIDLFHAGELREAVVEVDQLYQVWDTVRDARCDYYYVTVRRQALRTLRDLIGEAAYYRGEMPPPLPVWHLPRR